MLAEALCAALSLVQPCAAVDQSCVAVLPPTGSIQAREALVHGQSPAFCAHSTPKRRKCADKEQPTKALCAPHRIPLHRADPVPPLAAQPTAAMDEEMQEAPRQQTVQPPTFKAPKMVSRPKPPVQQEEELGAEPKLGDFEGEHALSISEARAIVTAIHTKRRQTEPGQNPLGGDRVHNDSQSIQQFVDYLDMFARYKQTENLHSMGGIFDANPQINSIERAMLGMSHGERG